MRNRSSAPSLDRLRAIPLFSACSTDELAAIDSMVDEADVVAGTTLTCEGRAGRETFIIVSGTAKVTRTGKRLAEVGPGAVVGEMAVLQRDARSATVTALSAMHLLVIAPAHLASLLAIEGVARKVMIGLSDRVRAADERITTSPTPAREGRQDAVPAQ